MSHQDASENDPAGCFAGTSARIRRSPIVDPTIDGGGAHTYSVINDFIGVFVEQVSCSYDAGPYNLTDGGRWNVYVRLMTAGGPGGGSDPDEEAGESLVQEIQLIE